MSTNLSPSLTEWKCVKIIVRFSKKKIPIQATLESSVRTFKGLIAQNCDICIQQQLLIYKGNILKDDETLQSYGLEADHAVYLICRSIPSDTNGGANDGIVEDEELPIREISDLGPLADEPIIHNLTNIIEILKHLAMNHPELQELMQQHPELAYIYNGPRDQIVVSSVPNTTPLPNPWIPTITGWHNPPDLEGMEDDRARLNAGLSTLTRLMHYPSIYQMILNILSDPKALRQIPVAVTNHPYMELNSLREAMQGLEQFHLVSTSILSSQQLLISQQALSSEDFELESQELGEELGEDDRDTDLERPEAEPSHATQILQPQEMRIPNLEENTKTLIFTSGNVDAAVEQHSGNSEPAEIVYATQLSQLQEMGFLNAQENIRALIATSGNVHAALERLQKNSD